MANEDSFINEVSEEVRREKLFRYIRRYGWIAVLAVLILVGGAAFNEWRKAQARAEAEARGDAVLTALEAASPEARASALSGIDGEGDAAAVLAMLAAGQAVEGGSPGAALDRLRAIAENPEIDPVYRDLAALKAILIEAPDLDPETQIARLEPLTVPGAPYSLLALEATALAHVAAGDTEAALSVLTDLMSDSAASQGLRRRASQLIVALGGSLEAG
ncbi:hypothetical protein [Ovoidimarina sediminis]|uniref:hypothetical protein n=1 Tax=Ovoidimarina sediminis TaxID=3079856 RepID=UPI0029137BFD|nr:hypothetical protein [Rhodophyticola sp. MJ-SS7]MDU8943231.1 hypothetical protein [Rhodophyticola sp. MJ-SS7]